MSEQQAICPDCGAEWPADLELSFCGDCGAELEVQSAELTDKERRTLTVVFADLSGFTARSERDDPEAVERVVDELFGELGDVVEEYGGYVDKYMGDAVMAVFGAPEAHEDDPLRAVHTGLEMLDVVASFNEERDDPLALSVGINTGEVVWSQIGGGDYTATGDAVNVAQRLEAEADEDTVLVSRDVQQRTSDRIEYIRRDPITIDGRDGRITPSIADSVREDVDADRERADVRAPLLGREAEHRRLLSRYEDESPSFVAVMGSAGIGKSRLVEEFKTELLAPQEELLVTEQQLVFGLGHCTEHADLPLEPFGEYLLSKAETSRSETDAGYEVAEAVLDDFENSEHDETRRENIAHLLAISIGLEVPNARVTDLPPEHMDEEIHRAWLAWLRHLSANRPVMLCLEDLQWADEATRTLLEQLCENLAEDEPEESVTIVGTYRPSGEPPDAFETIELEPLSVADTRAIAEAVLDGPVDDDLPAFLQEHAGGNPYFLEEFLRYLLENDLVEETDDRHALANRAAETATVPETLDGLLVGRIDALPSECQETLKAASVIGERFWVDMLAEIVDWDPDEAIEQLAAREMVSRCEESTLPGDREYAFKHALLRDAAYELLPKSTRKELHAAVATALETSTTSAETESVDDEEQIERATAIARHYERADDPAAAIEWYRNAADRAMDVYAHETAIEYAHRALELAEDEDRSEALAVRTSLAKWYLIIGEYDDAERFVDAVRERTDESDTRRRQRLARLAAEIAEARSEHERAIEEATAGLDLDDEPTPERCRLLDVHTTTERQQGNYESARATANEQYELASQLDDTELTAEALQNLGGIAQYQGSYDEARKYLQQALEGFERIDDRRGIATTRNNLGLVSFRQGDHDEAQEYLQEALEDYRKVGNRRDIGRSKMNLGVVLDNQGRYDEAREYYRDALEDKRMVGDRHGVAIIKSNLGLVAHEQGSYEQARESLKQALVEFEAVGAEHGIAQVQNDLGEVITELGVYDRARERSEAALSAYRELDTSEEAWALTNLGRIARLRGAHERAAEYLDGAIETFESAGEEHRAARARIERGALARQRGNHERAHGCLTAALETATDFGDQHRPARCHQQLGALARERDVYDRANEHLKKAHEGFQAVGDKHGLAIVRLRHGRLARDCEKYDVARDRLTDAFDAFQSLGVRHWIARAHHALGTLAMATGAPDEARERWLHALDRFEQIDAVDDALETLSALVEQAREYDDPQTAAKWCDRALELCDEYDEPQLGDRRTQFENVKESLDPETVTRS